MAEAGDDPPKLAENAANEAEPMAH